jgi:hypothetical protein
LAINLLKNSQFFQVKRVLKDVYLAQQKLHTLLEKHSSQITSVEDYVDLATFLEKELFVLNEKAYQKNTKRDLKIKIYELLEPIASRVSTLSFKTLPSLREKNTMGKIAISLNIKQLKEALEPKTQVKKGRMTSSYVKWEERQPWMREFCFFYTYTISPFLLVCSVSILVL